MTNGFRGRRVYDENYGTVTGSTYYNTNQSSWRHPRGTPSHQFTNGHNNVNRNSSTWSQTQHTSNRNYESNRQRLPGRPRGSGFYRYSSSNQNRNHNYSKWENRSHHANGDSADCPMEDDGSSAPLATTSTSAPVARFPGYVYDETKKKYFKVLPDSAAVPGYRKSDITAKQNKEFRAAIAANRPRMASGTFANRPVVEPLSTSLRNRQLGVKPSLRPETRLFESQLLNVTNVPNSVHKADINGGIEKVVGCQFLDVSRNGKTLFGCWAIADETGTGRKCSRIQCIDATIKPEIVKETALAADEDPYGCRKERNYLGLSMETNGLSYEVKHPNLVDMVTAPVDSDVTCLLYVTAATEISSRGLNTVCRVFLSPVVELSREEDHDILSSPIYNYNYQFKGAVWSCAWNANKMRVGLGLESSIKVLDVLSSEQFTVSTHKKSVLSQDFDSEGNCMYVGLKASDAVGIDMRSNEITSHLKRNRNVGYIKVLKEHGDFILTDNFMGQLRLWDARNLSREVFYLPGHRNSHYKLPIFVDHSEKAVFAVGEDGTTRGWSLRSGDLLSSVHCPRPVEERTDFPRVVYSDCWGQSVGSSALLLAVSDDLRVHELSL